MYIIAKYRLEKLKNLKQLFQDYQQVFAEVTHDSEIVANFIGVVTEIERLSNTISIPQSVVIQQRVVFNESIKREIKSAIVRVHSMTKMLNDNTFSLTIAHFRLKMRRMPSADLSSRVAEYLIEYVGAHPAEAAAVGLTAEKLAVLTKLVNDTKAIRLFTKTQSDFRKLDQNQLKTLSIQATRLLRDELDWLMADYQVSEPNLFNRFMMLRQHRKGHAKPETFTELTGTVTNRETGMPISGAKLKLINIRGDEVESDADGFYHFDELEPEAYQITCVAEGYQTGNAVAFRIQRGESLVVDFELIPVAAAA